MTTLTRQSRVCTLGIASTFGGAVFVAENTEEQVEEVLTLPYDQWDDMGQPDTITVTVEAGDLLNP